MTAAVTVAILHPPPGTADGPLSSAVGAARAELAERHRVGFLAAGATRAEVVSELPDGRPFGARLRRVVARLDTGEGLVVLGSGAVPLATAADRRRFVAAAAAGNGGSLEGPGAFVNNRYSADILAVPDARRVLADLPDLDADNGLPRWLAERGVAVDDRRGNWRLGVDIDTALDLVLLGPRWARHLSPGERGAVELALGAIRDAAGDPLAELLVAGRTSATTIAWLETATASRTRVLVEERGLRTVTVGQRPPASVLGELLEHDGPASLGRHLARLADAAVIDSRVLLAHRLGADERGWPPLEDRAASDLLLAERIADPWLRALTGAARDAPIPVVLGGHTLVGPGLRLALGRGR